jgi:hypothetical protein
LRTAKRCGPEQHNPWKGIAEMNVTRRGLLGMFAAGMAAAVLPSGIIMPVRKIIVRAAPKIVLMGDSDIEGAMSAAADEVHMNVAGHLVMYRHVRGGMMEVVKRIPVTQRELREGLRVPAQAHPFGFDMIGFRAAVQAPTRP